MKQEARNVRQELVDAQSVMDKIRAFNQGQTNKLREGEAFHRGSKGE